MRGIRAYAPLPRTIPKQTSAAAITVSVRPAIVTAC